MSIVNKVKRDIRKDICNTLHGEFSYIAGETASSTSTTSVVFSQLAGLMPDDHWKRATIRVTILGVPETRKVQSFDGDTCTFTPETAFSGTPDLTNGEVIRAGVNLIQVDTAIERAANALARVMLIDVFDSTTMIFDPGQTEYALPANTFTRVDEEKGIEFAWAMRATDRYLIPWGSTSISETTIQSSATALAQGFYVTEEILADGIALPIRKVGSPDYTLIAALRSNSSGVAGASLGAMDTVAATAFSVTRSHVFFTTAAPVRLTPETVFHISLAPGSGTVLDSSNYYTWLADSGTGTTDGYPSTSADSAVTFTAQSGFTRGFLVTDARERDWRYLENDDWYTVNGSTRSLTIKPDNHPPAPFPIRVRGQGSPPSIAGTANDGTYYEGDPEILTKVALAYLQMAMAMSRKDAILFGMAKKNEEDAMSWAKSLLPRARGVAVERV